MVLPIRVVSKGARFVSIVLGALAGHGVDMSPVLRACGVTNRACHRVVDLSVSNLFDIPRKASSVFL